MNEPTRVQDNGLTLYQYLGPALVRCPRCDKRAVVRNVELPGTVFERPYGQYRIQCSACAYSVDTAPDYRNFLDLGANPLDPYFRAPLFLQIDTRLGTLFAFNERHLDWLETFVSANLRERTNPGGPTAKSIATRLPRWIKLAKNRETILQAIAKLRAKLAA